MKRLILIFLLCCASFAHADQFTRSISQQSDDGWYRTGAAQFSLTSLYFVLGGLTGGDYYNGQRFQNVTIPQGAIIDSAFITMVCALASVETITGTFWCEDTASATTFTADSTAYKLRSKTTASVNWTRGPITLGVAYTTSNLAAPLQEVINRSDWASGNNLVFREESGTYTYRHFYASFDHTSYAEPQLNVWYHTLSIGGVPDLYHSIAGIGIRHSKEGSSVLHKK